MTSEKKAEIFKIDGVGLNLNRFVPVQGEQEKNALRQQYGFSSGDFILLYTAEFIPRKNHALLFDALSSLKNKIPELKLALLGKGDLLGSYKTLAEARGWDCVRFAGYTNAVREWCGLSDVFVMPSFQEGMPVALLEAMACGLPVAASRIRGHTDVIEDCVNGCLFDPRSVTEFLRAIWMLYKNPSLRIEMGARNIEKAKEYSVDAAVNSMAGIYKQLAGEE